MSTAELDELAGGGADLHARGDRPLERAALPTHDPDARLAAEGARPWQRDLTAAAIADALADVQGWLGHPNARLLQPGARHIDILARLLLECGTAGDLTNDAQSRFNSYAGTPAAPELSVFANTVVNTTLKAPAGDDSRYVVFTRSLNNTTDVRIPSEESDDVSLEAIPSSLRQSVSADPTRQSTTTIELLRAISFLARSSP